MERRRNKKSITLRLFATVFLVVLLLNILSVIGTLGLSEASRRNVIQEHSYALSLYMNQLDRELSQTQSRMYDLSRSNDYSLATLPLDGSTDPYRILRSQTVMAETLNDWLGQFPLIDGYYIMQPETGLLIICGSDSVYVLNLSKDLMGVSGENTSEETVISEENTSEETVISEENTSEEMVISGENTAEDGRWHLKKADDQGQLFFASVHHDTVYGAWVQEKRLLEEWGIERTGREHYELLAGSAKWRSDCVDVASECFDGILRYHMPSLESMVPTGVRILLIASIIMLCALPLVWFSMRKLVLLPLRELMGAIRHIEEGETGYRIPEKSTSSEFGQLNVQFNHSMDQLASMRMQVYESQLEKERIYVNYLSQQMQPHFVLNTLNLIFSMEPEEYDLIQETVTCLSDYYRYIAHVQEQLVPVEAEIAHVENYFKIQQIRYPDMFFYEIHCPENLKKCLIPPIIIQTFAENAIKHSLVVGEVNRVEILVEEVPSDSQEGVIHICIRDHGKGYPEETLEKIRLFRETGVQQDGLGLGIQNTIERIQLIYQNRGQLIFANAPDGGAVAELYLPVIIQEEER